MTPKISIIILCYRQEQYLERCCHSLFGQTLGELEFIFVIDDPQGESCAIIAAALQRYPDRKQQVHIIQNEQHLGISRSRQIGIDAATGDYITHCDADDWVELDAYERMYHHAVSNQSEVIGFDIFQNSTEAVDSQYIRCVDSIEEGFQCVNGSLCNKLISRQFIVDHGIRFPQGIDWGEDMCFAIQCRTLANHIDHVSEAYYHYEAHAESFTKAVTKAKYAQFVRSGAFIESFLKDRMLLDKYQLWLNELKFFCKEYYLIQSDLRDIRLWSSIYQECHHDIWRYPNIPFYLKVIASLIVKGYPSVASFLLDVRDFINTILHRA